jgi:hypothetical protein
LQMAVDEGTQRYLWSDITMPYVVNKDQVEESDQILNEDGIIVGDKNFEL